ncbi:MAG TPA: 4-alpha-glucanotransferase, partial [Ilumatobacteraceae bacterium]
VATQIYSMWSERSWGIGDLDDLLTLAEAVERAGGRAILVSPLHQPAPWPHQEDSPYYPSSRRAWTPLLLGLHDPPPDELRLGDGELIDRSAVWTAKRRHLEQLFAQSTSPPPVPHMVAIWNALCDEHGPNWLQWPADVRRPDTDVIAARLAADPDFAQRAAFHEWCQSLVEQQLARLTATGVAIIGDLALGFSPGGADAWEYQDLLALTMRVGAPPDPFSLEGQEWGIPPFIPWKLRDAWYEPFIATIRAALRGVGALRIDHVMGLFRQFWIPSGFPPSAGAYVHYDADELLAIICLEATRAGAFVVGEDLGTVAPGVRERLAECGIASTKVLWFEDEHPSNWPEEALATITTHDLATIAGVFAGTDGTEEQRDRLAIVTTAETVADAIDDAHRALLESPARLRLVSIDDLCAAPERPNHPGTIDRPNWRRRLPTAVTSIALPAPPSVPAAGRPS